MSRTAIRTRGALASIVVLALLAVALTGCGVGRASSEEKISKTAVTYLRALADGDAATACAQLTRAAKGSACEASMKERLSGLESGALKRAADDSMDIEVDGATATAGLSEPEGARFVFKRIGGDWRIDSGYTLGATTSAQIPETPVGRQVAWALAQLNGGAAKLSAADITRRFSPEFLSVLMPASELVASLEQTASDRGPFTFAGFAYPPTATQAVALLDTTAGERGSLRIQLDRAKPARTFRFEVSAAPPAIQAIGSYSGRFDIGGRKLFLHCAGSGSPTIVFQGGLASDWAEVQVRVARLTRACSYDPANGLWGRSDPAPTPRTAEDVIADLHALLAVAQVPGPYVLVGRVTPARVGCVTSARPAECASL